MILALIQLTRRQNNFARPEVHFTRLQLIDLLGWPDKGRSYDRIAASLDRWASTYLKYENAWWDNEGRRWTSGGFHIIDSYKLGDGRAAGGRGRAVHSRVIWGKEFFKSCQAGYLKSLDYDLYVRLNGHPAKRMYRFLDKRFYHKPEWEFELKDFAFEHVGLSRTYRDAGKIKEKLQRGIEELEQVGFLEPLPRDERYVKQGRRWVVRMVRKQAEPAPEVAVGTAEEPIVRELVGPRRDAATAVELARQHPAEAIARHARGPRLAGRAGGPPDPPEPGRLPRRVDPQGATPRRRASSRRPTASRTAARGRRPLQPRRGGPPPPAREADRRDQADRAAAADATGRPSTPRAGAGSTRRPWPPPIPRSPPPTARCARPRSRPSTSATASATRTSSLSSSPGTALDRPPGSPRRVITAPEPLASRLPPHHALDLGEPPSELAERAEFDLLPGS